MQSVPSEKDFFWNLGFNTIQELETEKGILASSSQEIYGCIFGRDSLITALKLLRAFDASHEPYFLSLVKKILANLTALQGRQVNIESGEEPGKCIHEFRPERHEHLTKHPVNPWYVYPDNIMRNYDTVDATPLLLITIYRYWQKSKDQAFLEQLSPNIDAALKWMMAFGDKNNDGFIDYRPHPDRKFGGLVTQNWMDSAESVFHENGEKVTYPIAPVEVQGYAYLAYRLWADYFKERDKNLAAQLTERADNLMQRFNQKFVLTGDNGFSIASGMDGAGRPLTSPRSSMGHLLWASRGLVEDRVNDCILEESFIPLLVNRLMAPDLFEPEAGLRTLSSLSSQYQANSYHNGSIWPHDNSMVAEGLEQFGYKEESKKIRRGILKALAHFQSPVELFVYDNGQYLEYRSAAGQTACKKQAWSAASLLTASLALQES